MAVYVKDKDGGRVKVAGLGAQGPAGKSAYQYAAEGGFSGSEDEFRALMGVRSNPNLLHNAYWAQKDYIINQLGQEEYTGSGYTIDRWMAFGLTVTLEDGWLKLYNPTESNGHFVQREEIGGYDSLVGSRCTFSALYKCDKQGCAVRGDAVNEDGVVIQSILPFTGLESDSQPHIVSAASGVIQPLTMPRWRPFAALVAPGATVWLKAAKLELGPNQTLAHKEGDVWVLNDPPPNKALELSKCQRHMLVLDSFGDGYAGLAQGSSYSATNLTLNIPTPVSMRAKPALSMSGRFMIRGGGRSIEVDPLTQTYGVGSYSENVVTIDIGKFSNLPIMQMFELIFFGDKSARIILDANL